MEKISQQKQTMRDELCDQHLASSKSVLSTVENWDVFLSKNSVASYIAMKDEVDIDALLSSDKKIFLPVYDKEEQSYKMAQVNGKEDLVEGKFGILEPSGNCPLAAENDIELWLVPGRGFDKKGNRLGRGGGFYDRLLANENGLKAGIPANGRVLEHIPSEEWDVKMNFLVLENEIFECK